MKTKDTLLDHAEALARTRGMDAFSFADLAQALAIKKASVHYHFPTKADLIASVLTRYTERFLASLPTEGTAAQRIAAYLDLYRLALGAGDQVCLCVSLSGSRASLRDDAAMAVDAFHSASLAWLESVFVQAALDGSLYDPGLATAEAGNCLALVEGAQLIARTAGDPTKFDQATALMRSRLLL